MQDATPQFKAKLGYYISKSGLTFRELSDKAYLSTTYTFNLAAGHRLRPSRDVIIRLCFALRLDLAETDELLTLSGHPPLVD